MCKVDVYPFLNPDGTQSQRREKTKCEVARRGSECRDRQVFRHALQGGQLPPSPLSTPRSSTPNYRSGDESGGSSGSRNRRSGVYIEVNGRPVYQEPERRRRRNPERVVVVESPPTARTPPREPFLPRTAPPSPSPLDSRPRGLGLRPIIVDERVRPTVLINTVAPEYAGHRRTPSNSSHRSRGSNTSDDAGRWDPFFVSTPATRRPSGPTQAELDQERLQRRIAAANAEINRRPAVPMPPTPPQRSASTYIRPAVELRMRRPDVGPRLVDPSSISHPDPIIERALRDDAARNIRRAREEEERRRREEAEEEAQRQRLRERMTPQRRASVSGSGRRTRVMYPDGVYRWE